MFSGLLLFKWNSSYTDFLSKQETFEFLKGSTKKLVLVLFLQPSRISESLKIILNGFMPFGGEEKGTKQTYLVLQVPKSWNYSIQALVKFLQQIHIY